VRPVILALLALLVGPALADKGSNPHSAPDACAACHAPTVEGMPPEGIQFTTGNPNDACRSCHDEDPHQVDLTPRADQQIPKYMLLLNGKVACFSCHDNPSCDGRTVDVQNDPYFFRGGPYPTMGGLCAQCHAVTGTQRFNPHKSMSEACEHCHLKVPETGAAESDLKVNGPNICLGCHQEETHAGGRVHLGPIPEAMVATVEASGLPITSKHEIVCITCHDPHPGRVLGRLEEEPATVGTDLFPKKWLDDVLAPALAARGNFEPKTTEPDFLRRPLTDGALCKSCHTPDAIEALKESQK
jgi:predicted CXXCH cytochrome family protein